jgi:hypothetical protein
MSDEEMNIDEGTCSNSLYNDQLMPLLKVANGGGLIRKRGRGFQSSAGLYPCHVQYHTFGF